MTRAATPAQGDTFAKANGLGDLELICEPPPIEVGNYVWFDGDRNGIQDPDEMPAAGVSVALFDSVGTLLATAITDATGYYLFSSDPNRVDDDGDGVMDRIYGIAGLGFNQDFTIAVLDSNFVGGPLTGWVPTLNDIDGDPNNDSETDQLRDSDGVTVAVTGSTFGVSFTTGQPGENDHRYDFGVFQPASLELAKQVTGDLAGYVAGSQFEFTVDCTDNTLDRLPPNTILLADGDSIVLSGGIPGSSCTIAEITTPATADASFMWAPPVWLPSNPIVLGAGGTTTTVTAQNQVTQDSGSIEFTKRVSGDLTQLPPGSIFDFTVDCNDDTLDQSFSLQMEQTFTLDPVAVGTACTFSEVQFPSLNSGYEWGTPVYVPSATGTVTTDGEVVAIEATNLITESEDELYAIPTLRFWGFLGLVLLLLAAGVSRIRA